jgi:hypothetical protein
MKESRKCDERGSSEEGKARRKEKYREIVLRGKKMIGRKARKQYGKEKQIMVLFKKKKRGQGLQLYTDKKKEMTDKS